MGMFHGGATGPEAGSLPDAIAKRSAVRIGVVCRTVAASGDKGREGRCVNCGTSNVAAAVACAQCGAELVMACSRCGHVNHLGETACVGCGVMLPPATFAGCWRGVGRVRQLTVLFADLEGSTHLAESVDAEVLH